MAGLPISVCLIYLLVPGRSFEEEIHNIQQVFDHQQLAGLKLSPKKCFLFQRGVKFLGHIVSKDGVAIVPAKVQAVQDWPTPTGVTEVKRFLGSCSYYRSFIRGLADIAILCISVQRRHIHLCGPVKLMELLLISNVPLYMPEAVICE